MLLRSFAAFLLVAVSVPAWAAENWSGASWIWSDADALADAPNDPVYFRYVIELAEKPQSATVSITVDNKYELFVNGERVGGDDAWETPETLDVAKLLKPGKNVIAIRAANAGGSAGCIAKFTAKLPGGKTVAVGTSNKWKSSTKADDKWLAAAFDDSKWKPAAVIADAGGGPWNLISRTGGSNNAPTDRNVSDPKIRDYRPASEEIEQFALPEKFKIELIAAEPLIINPVCIALDEKNRLYVSESHTYRYGPSGSPVKGPPNPIVRLDPAADGKTFTRTLVADGFEDPVMGMVIRDGHLWAAANNYLFRFDTSEAGPATNKQTLLVDKNKAWNPFGMFVLEFGPEGDLYMSVGNHDIDIGPPGQKEKGIGGRGGSGVVLRMKPDGTQLERLVHGLRVPYAFDFDPFGQLWQLSNGEGNPNRFVRVIEGIDYHCYSRGQVSNEWLAGRHPLAPPSFELPRGACTQLLRYYGANFPKEYQGSLFLDNWGAHGFGGPNRTLFRYVPDERNNIAEKQDFLVCRDPHFRCSHVIYAPDGSLLIADWYGRDDESDLTGRIWRVSYTGDDKPKVEHELESPKWADAEYALSALGSPDHRVREKAMATLAKQGEKVIPALAKQAESAPALAAAHALWSLVRIGSPEAYAKLPSGAKHADWRVRRQTLQLLNRYKSSQLEATAVELAKDKDPAVRVAAAAVRADASHKREALVAALENGAAEDVHLRYEAAWFLADVADDAALLKLLASDREEVRLAGLITIDIAGYENRGGKDAAMKVLAEKLVSPGELESKYVFELARLHDSPALVEALRQIVARQDADAAQTATALLLLRSKSSGAALDKQAVAKFMEAVKSGGVSIQSASDWLTLLELISAEGPNEFALQRVAGGLTHGDQRVREAAHALARSWGTKASELAPPLWTRVLQAQNKNASEKLLYLTTILAIEAEPNVENWQKLLETADGPLLIDAVRSFRKFGSQPSMVGMLERAYARLIKKDPSFKDDLAAVIAAWPSPEEYRKKLGVEVLVLPESVDAYKSAATSLQSSEDAKLLGRRVFERTGCTKCHTTLSQNTERAPSLANIGKAQKIEYLIESVLEPSTVIKTGFETEIITTKEGKVHSGLVKEAGDKLRVLTADAETTILKSEIEDRAVQKKSLMPDGQHKLLSPREFAELVAYLRSL
jgi:putative membrane-bound dehydrogenase-like protein